MATYIPLARKYRPQDFDQLIGQDHVSSTLKRAIEQERVAQAYLFTGVRGVGKTSAARILAKALNCEKGPTPTPCNECTNCQQVTSGHNMDVTEIDGASNRGIDEIRSLRETLAYAPTNARYHVHIIDEVHMLTTEAFNALLKTLEEPPEHVKFVFATTEPRKVPATILSRCQRFDFRRIELKTMVAHLKTLAEAENIQIDEAALYAIARSADGSLRDAEVVLDQLGSYVEGTVTENDVIELLGALGADALFDLMHAILTKDAAATFKLLMQQKDQGKEAAEILSNLLRHVRNLMVLAALEGSSGQATLSEQLIDEPAERIARLQEQTKTVTTQELLMFLQMLNGSYELIRRSAMSWLVLELVLIQIATRGDWDSLEALIQKASTISAEAKPQQAAQPAPITRKVEAPKPAPKVAPATRVQPSKFEITQSIPSPTVQEVSEEPVKQKPAPPEPKIKPVLVVDPNRNISAQVQEALDDVYVNWPEFLEKLGGMKMSLAAYLTDSRPIDLDGKKLTIGLTGAALQAEVLSTRENRVLVSQVLAEVSKQSFVIEFATIGGPKKEVEKSDVVVDDSKPALVQDIVKLFNATVVE